MAAWIMNAYAGAIALTLLALLVFLGGIPHSLASHECTWSALHPRLTGVLCLTAAPYNVALLGDAHVYAHRTRNIEPPRKATL